MDFSELIKKLDDKLILDEAKTVNDKIELTCHKEVHEASCPYCGSICDRVHSTYIRTIQDLSIQSYFVKLKLVCHKYFCDNPECQHKTFAERFTFVEEKAVRTNRLTEYVSKIALRNSSMDTVRDLKDNFIEMSLDTVLRIIKKNRRQ